VKRFRLWLIALIVLALLVAGKFAMDSARPASSARGHGAGGGGPTPVRVAVLKSERLADRITSVGTVLPNERVDVRSEISGRVREIHFTGRRTVASPMQFRNERVFMGGELRPPEFDRAVADAGRIAQIIGAARG